MSRKNWASSWTVLQGSSLLFAKGQGGGTSWVCIPSSSERLSFSTSSAFFPFLSILCLSLLYFCLFFWIIFFCCCPSVFTPLFSSFLKSYCRSGLLPELLLTLLSSWKHSVKPRPAVSYMNCQPVQAAAVCLLSAAAFIPSFTPALAHLQCGVCICEPHLIKKTTHNSTCNMFVGLNNYLHKVFFRLCLCLKTKSSIWYWPKVTQFILGSYQSQLPHFIQISAHFLEWCWFTMCWCH